MKINNGQQQTIKKEEWGGGEFGCVGNFFIYCITLFAYEEEMKYV